jgi:hypothetical protein
MITCQKNHLLAKRILFTCQKKNTPFINQLEVIKLVEEKHV